MDKIIEGMKFFDDSLSKKGKMTRDDFAVSRRVNTKTKWINLLQNMQ